MPAYVAGTAKALYPGDSVLAYNAEQPATGAQSSAFAIGAAPGFDTPSVSVQISFAAAPGAFSFGVYEADVDTAASYLQVPSGSPVTTVNANNVARVDLSPFVGAFIAINTILQNANATNATVRITRHA